MEFSKFKKMDFQSINPINQLYGDFNSVINLWKQDHKIFDDALNMMGQEEFVSSLLQKLLIFKNIKKEEIKSERKQKFMYLTFEGKILFFLKVIELSSNDKSYQNDYISKLCRYLDKCNNLNIIDNVDQVFLSLVNNNEELCKLLAIDLKYAAVRLPKTFNYLYKNNYISRDEAFEKDSMKLMGKDYKELVVNNIDPKNLKNIIYYNYIGYLPKEKYDEMMEGLSKVRFSTNIDEVYEGLSKVKDYPPFLEVIDVFKNNGINISERDKKFLVYISFAYRRFSEAESDHLKQAKFSTKLIEQIIEVALVCGGFSKIVNIFEKFVEFENNKETCIKDCLSFCVGYYDKKIFEELSSDDTINLTPELINKIIKISRSSAYKEINSLSDLSNIKDEDFSKLTIDSSKDNKEVLSVRYHPITHDSKRKDRSIIAIDTLGTVTRKKVNGHSIGLQELYGVMPKNHLNQVSECVNIKGDIIIISADEYVEVFLHRKVNKEQIAALLSVLKGIGKDATYTIGICNEDFTVTSASKTDEDVMDYDSLIAILERIDFMKNQDDAEEKTK